MDRAKQREIASKGGKAAHQKGTAHEWTSEEARDAGRKGGIASHQRRREQSGSQSGGDADDTIAMDRSASRSSGMASSSGSNGPGSNSGSSGMDRETYGSERGRSNESSGGNWSEE